MRVASTARTLVLGLPAAMLVCAVATAACLTAPPPDLVADTQAPTIDIVALQPPEGIPLTTLPISFTVPIQIQDPTQCRYSVFDEYTTYIPCRPCGPSLVDGGIELVEFSLTAQADFDISLCHTIQFTVGSSFAGADQFCHSGSAVATWVYQPPSCEAYDAATLDDGSFPDASSDGLLIVPESGVEQ